MFSPARTALYLAIGVLSFAANEAAAQTCAPGKKACVTNGGFKSCWCTGSEICSVQASDTDIQNLLGVPAAETFARCTVTGAVTTMDGGEGFSCPMSGTLPTGTLTCDGGEGGPLFTLTNLSFAGPGPGGAIGIASTSLGDCADPDVNGHIFGFSGVTVSGGSTVGTLGNFNGLVCSNTSVAVSGSNTNVHGDAVAVTTINVTGGADVTGAPKPGQSAATIPSTPGHVLPLQHAPPGRCRHRRDLQLRHRHTQTVGRRHRDACPGRLLLQHRYAGRGKHSRHFGSHDGQYERRVHPQWRQQCVQYER